jgi:hypothetical protein
LAAHLVEPARAQERAEQVPGRGSLGRVHGFERHAGPAARHVVPALAQAARPIELCLALLALIERGQPRAGGAAHVAGGLRHGGPGRMGQRGGHAGRRRRSQERAAADAAVPMVVRQADLT